jgi:hypothetical protein
MAKISRWLFILVSNIQNNGKSAKRSKMSIMSPAPILYGMDFSAPLINSSLPSNPLESSYQYRGNYGHKNQKQIAHRRRVAHVHEGQPGAIDV